MYAAAGVASLTPADLAAHIAAWQRPDGAILGLVGDFSSKDMMKTVKEVSRERVFSHALCLVSMAAINAHAVVAMCMRPYAQMNLKAQVSS
jgi:hypothetical protein